MESIGQARLPFASGHEVRLYRLRRSACFALTRLKYFAIELLACLDRRALKS